MGNMAKAKNIATGTVNGSNNKTLTISGLNFRPDHVAIVGISGSADNQRVLAVYDNSQVSRNYYANTLYAQLTSLSFTDDGVTMTSNTYQYRPPNTSSYRDTNDLFAGIYNYVAWQE
jgi:hypothetical protein